MLYCKVHRLLALSIFRARHRGAFCVVGEDKDLSGKATIELRRLFPGKKISKVTETNLSANQERAEMEKNKLTWKSEDFRAKNSKVTRGSPVDPAKLIIEIGVENTLLYDVHASVIRVSWVLCINDWNSIELGFEVLFVSTDDYERLSFGLRSIPTYPFKLNFS
ncbi:hypothetical protein Cgig2_001070 [Carnegiea gigantea]|uniref:Uncharacterized protein n=1 Tax=Carnegiea gigantea TaxID=171969 RepID=A0A9Q1QAU2_9CARY|nr:hypothetical protein Cgig2_001070 [Carnegiea gigantea]